jgi:hypothetical protein
MIGGAARGRPDDRRERGRDEQGVAQAPPGAEADHGIDASRYGAQQSEHDDEAEADQQRRLRADAEEIQLVTSIARPVTTR